MCTVPMFAPERRAMNEDDIDYEELLNEYSKNPQDTAF